MIILDTDHLTELQYGVSEAADRLITRLEAAGDDDVRITIVSVEEQFKGWLAKINSTKSVTGQTSYYDRLADLIVFYRGRDILRFDLGAALIFEAFRRQGIRIGTSDLKIASIAIAQESTLLSANLRDFQKVPGLRVEDWLHG